MSDEKPLSEWLASGRRFTEEDATLLALDVAAELEEAHREASPGHMRPGLETIFWSPGRRRARLGGLRVDCRGFDDDARGLGEAVAALLGASNPMDRSGLRLSPHFAGALDRMLAESPKGRPRTPSALRRELGGALSGSPPLRVVLGSRSLQARAVAAVAVALLAWSVHRGLTGPNRILVLAGRVRAVAFSPDGRRFAASHEAGVRVWDTTTWGTRELDFPKPREASFSHASLLAFSPDGRRLAVARLAFIEPDRIGAVELWDLERGSRLWRLEGLGTVSALGFSPDGSLLAVAANRERLRDDRRPTPGELAVVDAAGGTDYGRIQGGDGAFHGLWWTQAGRLQYRVRLWRRGYASYGRYLLAERDAALKETETVLASLGSDADQPVARSRDGRRFAWLDFGTEIVRIHGERGEPLTALNRDIFNLEYRYRAFTAGAFSPDGRRFAACFSTGGRGGAKRRIRLWDTKDWSLAREKPLRAGRGLKNPVVWALAMSDRWLAASYGNDFRTEIHLWNIAR